MMELICCVCGRVKRDNEWVAEPARRDTLLSHGYCPACKEAFLVELRRTKTEILNRSVA